MHRGGKIEPDEGNIVEDNPAHDHIRQAVSEAAVRRIAAFPFSVPTDAKTWPRSS